MQNRIYLSVIIPAYNEEKRLPKTLEDIDRYLSRQVYNYEIIVVNDGSKDKTAQVVQGLSSKIRNFKLIDNKENRGKGFVVRQGMMEAEGEYRLFTDADNSTLIDQVAKLLPYFKQEYDVVIGSRRIEGAVLDPPQPFHRQLLGRMFGLLTDILVGTWGIKDTQCGFKCFSQRAVKDIFPKCRIDRFAFDPEMLIIARKLGYKIKEVPVTWRNDLDSKVKFGSMIKMGVDLLKVRWNLITYKYI